MAFGILKCDIAYIDTDGMIAFKSTSLPPMDKNFSI
jgi:hypothetical protein